MHVRDLIPLSRNRMSLRETRAPEPFHVLQREMNRMFDDLWRGFDWPWALEGPAAANGAWAPRVDVAENDTEIRITAELPGVDEKDIEVTFADGVLTLHGERKAESEEKGDSYYLKERTYGAFRRSFDVGPFVDENKVDATFKNGVLTIVLPKTEEAKQKAKRIPIHA